MSMANHPPAVDPNSSTGPGLDARFATSASAEPVSSPSRPIRPSIDYSSDLDDDRLASNDGGYGEPLVPKGGSISPFTRGHRPRPSTTALLDSDGMFSIDRHRRVNSYEDDRPSFMSFTRQLQTAWTRHFVAVKGVAYRSEGLLLIALAQLGFALINMCVKLLERDIEVPVWELILIRMAMTWVGCYTYLRLSGDPYPFAGPPGVRMLLALRGFVGFFGLYTNYAALKYLSMSDTSTLFFLSPILVGILGYLLLSEPYSRIEALVGLASLCGTVFIAKPTFLFPSSGLSEDIPGHKVTAEGRAFGISLVLGGCFTSSLVAIIIRFIGQRASPLHSISYFCIYSVIVSASYPLIFNDPPVFALSPRFFGLLLPIGILGFLAQALITRGFVLEKAGRGGLAQYSGLLFTLVIERIAFNKTPDAWSLLGAIIIVSGAVRVALEPRPKSDLDHLAGSAAAPAGAVGGGIGGHARIPVPAHVEGTELAQTQVVGGRDRTGYDKLATAEAGRYDERGRQQSIR